MNVVDLAYHDIDRLREFADELDGFLSVTADGFFETGMSLLRGFIRTTKPFYELIRQVGDYGSYASPSPLPGVGEAVHRVMGAYHATSDLLRDIKNHSLEEIAKEAEDILHGELLDHSCDFPED